MSISIIIPTALKQYAEEHTNLTLEAQTVGQAMEHLTRVFPELRRHLYTEQDRLRSFVNVYLNDEDIRHTQGSDTALKDGDTIMIVPAIAGGSTRDKRPEFPKSTPVTFVPLVVILFPATAGRNAAGTHAISGSSEPSRRSRNCR